MKKIFGFLLAIGLLLICSTALADTQSGLFTYKLKGNGTAVITGFDWSKNGKRDIYVPHQIDGYTVTEIGEEAFTNTDEVRFYPPGSDGYYDIFETVIWGEEVNVILPDTITTIRKKAFFCTAITSINIPESVKVIEGGALSGCIYLTKISVASSNTSFATIDGILYNKNEKKLIAVPNGSFGSYYRYKGEGHPGYDIISVPNGILSIGDYAFYGMALTGVHNGLVGIELPPSVEKIGAYAFSHTCIGSVKGYSVREEEKEIYKDAVFSLANVKEIGECAFLRAFFNCVGLDLSNVETIQDYAFCNVRDSYNANRDIMQTFVFPETLKHIGCSSFNSFNAFPVVMLDLSKTKLTEIPDYAFGEFCNWNGHYMQQTIKADILFPPTLERIGERAFELNGYILNFIVPSSVVEIDDYAFRGSSVNITFNDDSALTKIGERAFYNTRFFKDNNQLTKQLILPTNLREIGAEAFFIDQSKIIPDALRELIIPDSVITIGNSICIRSITTIVASPDSFAALYASENGIPFTPVGGEDTSWLDN